MSQQRGRGDQRGGPRGRGDFADRGRGFGGGRGGDQRGGPRGRGGGDFRGRGGFPDRGRGGPRIFREGAPVSIDQRLSGSQNDLAVVKAFSALQVDTDPARPLRPGYGTAGTPITLRANFFSLRLPKSSMYDYSVEITPTTDINRLKIRIFALLEEASAYKDFVSHVAHDGSSRLVSAKPLPQPLNIAVPYYEDGASPKRGDKVYTVSIKLTRKLEPNQITQYMDGQAQFRDYDPLPLISALNLVLQQHASRTGVRVGQGKYFFPTSSQGFQLGFGIQAFQGFYASVRPTHKQLMVNVNACMTAFVQPGNLADVMLAYIQQSRGANLTLPKEWFKRIKVMSTHLGYKRRYTLTGVGTQSARKTFFESEKDGRISIEQYFLKVYKIKLKHADDLPVIDVGNKKRTYLPVELCTIEPGQAYRGKLSDTQTAEMIRYACNPPGANAVSIVETGFEKLGLKSPTSPSADFGVSVSNEMAVIPARELPPPQLNYRSGQARVANGAWNIVNTKFHLGAQVPSWAVMVVQEPGKGPFSGPQDPELGRIWGVFARKMQTSGMTVGGDPAILLAKLVHPAEDPGRMRSLNAIRTVLRSHPKGRKPAFVLVLLSQRDNFIYPGIKRIGDVELGINTVHVLVSKVIGKDDNKVDQYFSNVALKVNTKLGGINHKLNDDAMKWLRKKPTMMVGIDVTHRGPGSKSGTPSIAAVVASVDDNFVQFPASIRLQQTDEVKEMLDELGDMMVERLQVYEKKNKALPQRIFVFRDGVSEGQYDTVLTEELPQILKAFQKFNTAARKTPYRPQLSIIICGKRHHARFFSTDSQFADKNGNTRPGTVVDRGVTNVFEFDFYLQAHAGLQGSVKPTHYTVIYDETKFSADEIQQGANNASYQYARATRAVSLIPPAYYADLACERGRCYLNDFLVDDTKSSSGGSASGSTRGDRKAEDLKVFQGAKDAWGEGLHPDMRGTMFYI